MPGGWLEFSGGGLCQSHSYWPQSTLPLPRNTLSPPSYHHLHVPPATWYPTCLCQPLGLWMQWWWAGAGLSASATCLWVGMSIFYDGSHWHSERIGLCCAFGMQGRMDFSKDRRWLLVHLFADIWAGVQILKHDLAWGNAWDISSKEVGLVQFFTLLQAKANFLVWMDEGNQSQFPFSDLEWGDTALAVFLWFNLLS